MCWVSYLNPTYRKPGFSEKKPGFFVSAGSEKMIFPLAFSFQIIYNQL